VPRFPFSDASRRRGVTDAGHHTKSRARLHGNAKHGGRRHDVIRRVLAFYLDLEGAGV
jgi:hypothetical protein